MPARACMDAIESKSITSAEAAPEADRFAGRLKWEVHGGEVHRYRFHASDLEELWNLLQPPAGHRRASWRVGQTTSVRSTARPPPKRNRGGSRRSMPTLPSRRLPRDRSWARGSIRHCRHFARDQQATGSLTVIAFAKAKFLTTCRIPGGGSPDKAGVSPEGRCCGSPSATRASSTQSPPTGLVAAIPDGS